MFLISWHSSAFLFSRPFGICCLVRCCCLCVARACAHTQILCFVAFVLKGLHCLSESVAFDPHPSRVLMPPPPAEPGLTGRRVRLQAADFDVHGYTLGCAACRRHEFQGRRFNGHTEGCRRRMEELLRQMPEGRARVEKAYARVGNAALRETEMQQRKGDSSKTKATAATSARKVKRQQREVTEWKGACAPPDIRRPWDVFHEHVLSKVNDRPGATGGGREDSQAVQEFGALRAFRAVSLQELSAFAAWSAASGLADAMERVAVWTGKTRVVIGTPSWDGSRKSTQKSMDGDKKPHEPARRIPVSPAFNHAASGVWPVAGASAAVAGYPVAVEKKRGRPRGQRRVDKLDAKYSQWGREGGPSPASEAIDSV